MQIYKLDMECKGALATWKDKVVGVFTRLQILILSPLIWCITLCEWAMNGFRVEYPGHGNIVFGSSAVLRCLGNGNFGQSLEEILFGKIV